mmetsp:Transcript_16812/g.31223  ORF Transcript_16812/g.31223 Transcript_16812/m.31223 type:complete len:447 (-) Transcript_16812:57-1397(-)
MGSLCARRAPGMEPEAYVAARAKETKVFESKVPMNVSKEWPTKSWSAILKDTPLNPDAKPFPMPRSNLPRSGRAAPVKRVSSTQGSHPFNLESFPVPESSSTLPNLLNADSDDPEWMQFLSKRFQERQEKNTTRDLHQSNRRQFNPLNPGSRRAWQKQRTSDELVPGSSASAIASGSSSNAGVAPAVCSAIHTEEYLKLLKAGDSTKSNPRPTSKAKQVLPATYQQLPSRTGESTTIYSSDSAHFVTQDDLCTAKSLRDYNFSEAAYWSETDVVNRNVPAAHRLGRRPNMAKTKIRSYVMQDLSFELDRTVGFMLNRLQRFRDQHKSFKQDDNAYRRIVIGLKEVARRTRQAKLECLVVAPDIEENNDKGGVDDRMRELLATAYQMDIPVIFALSRSALGLALGNSLQISVIGVNDATGARGLLSQAIELSQTSRQAWLSRLPSKA